MLHTYSKLEIGLCLCALQGKVHLELRLSEVITDSGVINHKLATRWGYPHTLFSQMISYATLLWPLSLLDSSDFNLVILYRRITWILKSLLIKHIFIIFRILLLVKNTVTTHCGIVSALINILICINPWKWWTTNQSFCMSSLFLNKTLKRHFSSPYAFWSIKLL